MLRKVSKPRTKANTPFCHDPKTKTAREQVRQKRLLSKSAQRICLIRTKVNHPNCPVNRSIRPYPVLKLRGADAPFIHFADLFLALEPLLKALEVEIDDRRDVER